MLATVGEDNQANPHDPTRQRRPPPAAAIWALGFVSLLMDISSEMIHSLLPVFMVTVLGTSVWAVGLIEGFAEATALIVKVFSGVLSDYWGKRKPLAVLGYGLGAASKPLFALASTTGMLLAARLIDRIGKGIRGAPRDALVADLAPPGMRGAAFGLRQSLDTVGTVIGAPVGDPNATLFAQLQQRVDSGPGAECNGKPGGIFVLNNKAIGDGDRVLLQSVARMVFRDTAGTFSQQLDQRDAIAKAASAGSASAAPRAAQPTSTGAADASSNGVSGSTLPSGRDAGDLLAFNGFGGFTQDAREYVITTSSARMTPAPWVNVLANPDFGTMVSESGSATTWSENAHEFRLTPWNNDPVSDANTEAFYIRDEASGHFWSPTLLPTRTEAPYVTRHGFGYSVFEHVEDGMESELCIYVAMDAPVKFSVLTLRNRSDRLRRLTVTGYLDWVLGDERTKTLMHVVTQVDAATGALFARNAYNTDFAGRTAFFDVDDSAELVCGDRGDFFGAGGTLAAPAALAQAQLSGRVGAALDPCAALRVAFELAPGEERTVTFRLGAGKSLDEARSLVTRWRGNDAAHAALEGVHSYWQDTLGVIQVQTPDGTLNALANGWLLYQVIASRLWGRTAFYQSSGAFGFRDQLQDVMALVHAQPGLVREHLLRAASRQFPEGDVQHWWHPPSGKGVRTRCSDDYLWLPLATSRYVETTGDIGVLDESCHFLEGRLLKDDEQSNYELPKTSTQSASLYEHCVRSIRRGLHYGTHGLPLMAAGDWNDGMNLVGADGKGESVWLGFFLITVLTRFAPLARQYKDPTFADLCESQASELRQRIEAAGWMAPGIGAAGSTTAHRLGRPATRSARSIPSRKAGQCCPTQQRLSVQALR